jgi:hypothetical protein
MSDIVEELLAGILPSTEGAKQAPIKALAAAKASPPAHSVKTAPRLLAAKVLSERRTQPARPVDAPVAQARSVAPAVAPKPAAPIAAAKPVVKVEAPVRPVAKAEPMRVSPAPMRVSPAPARVESEAKLAPAPKVEPVRPPAAVVPAVDATGRPAPTPAAQVVAPRVQAPQGDYRVIRF